MKPPGVGAAPGQPPFGSSPMTMPAPNVGLQAAAKAKLVWAVKILEQVLPAFGAGSDEGKDVMKALSSLSRHIGAGAGSPGVEASAMQKMFLESRQDNPMLDAMKQKMGAMPMGAPGGPALGGGSAAAPAPGA